MELETEKRTGFLRSGYQAKKKKAAALKGDPWESVRESGVLVLGTPVWAANGTPAMNSFIKGADLTGKRVYLFTVQADPETRSAGTIHSYFKELILDAGGQPAGTLALHGAPPGKTAPAGAFDRLLEAWEIC